jgi:stage 0 sporulation protein B (sporulation initiation phosphotransferase)
MLKTLGEISMENKPKEWNTVDILSHSRHDWMNNLQLIKGNLSLQKYDRVNEIIEELVIEAQQESKLCNLKMPAFASLLLTFNWCNHHFVLEYEVLGKVLSIEAYDDIMTQWSKKFLDILDKTVDACSENHLSITIDISSEEEGIRFFFDFNGIIKDTDQLKNWFQSGKHSQIDVNEFHINTYELTTVISLQ